LTPSFTLGVGSGPSETFGFRGGIEEEVKDGSIVVFPRSDDLYGTLLPMMALPPAAPDYFAGWEANQSAHPYPQLQRIVDHFAINWTLIVHTGIEERCITVPLPPLGVPCNPLDVRDIADVLYGNNQFGQLLDADLLVVDDTFANLALYLALAPLGLGDYPQAVADLRTLRNKIAPRVTQVVEIVGPYIP
jgi:hypothetical protein